MSEFSASETAAIKGFLAARQKPQIRIVNGRPFDLSKARKPLVSEDNKLKMYANPRLMLKDKTKPTYDQDPENGVEYEWLLKGSYERLNRRKDYRPVTIDEVDFDSPCCKLDKEKRTFDKEAGKALNIVTSGEFELFEVKGESAYLLKRYGADQYLDGLKGHGERSLTAEAADSRLPLNGTQFVEDPGWEPGTLGNLADPSTWGGRGGKFV